MISKIYAGLVIVLLATVPRVVPAEAAETREFSFVEPGSKTTYTIRFALDKKATPGTPESGKGEIEHTDKNKKVPDGNFTGKWLAKVEGDEDKKNPRIRVTITGESEKGKAQIIIDYLKDQKKTDTAAWNVQWSNDIGSGQSKMTSDELKEALKALHELGFIKELKT